MIKRNIEWFYKAPECSPVVSRLPEYLELYYQLFKGTFVGGSDVDKRFSYLTWLLSAKVEQHELINSHTDKYVYQLLNIDHGDEEVLKDVFLSNYHYYYYKLHEETFIDWGIDLKEEAASKKLFLWFLRLNLSEHTFPYLEESYNEYLVPSCKYSYEKLEITKVFEVFIDDYFVRAPDACFPETVEAAVVWVVFNYSVNQYQLSEKQIEQLGFKQKGNSLANELLDIYVSVLHFEDKIENYEILNTHPIIKKILGPID